MVAAMSARERARNVVAALFDTYNRNDVEGTTRLYAEGIRLWSPLTGAQRGKDQAVERTRALFDQLRNDRVTADTVVTNGTATVVEFTSQGAAPSGRPYTMAFSCVIELEGDLIAEVRTYIDPNDVARATAR